MRLGFYTVDETPTNSASTFNASDVGDILVESGSRTIKNGVDK